MSSIESIATEQGPGPTASDCHGLLFHGMEFSAFNIYLQYTLMTPDLHEKNLEQCAHHVDYKTIDRAIPGHLEKKLKIRNMSPMWNIGPTLCRYLAMHATGPRDLHITAI